MQPWTRQVIHRSLLLKHLLMMALALRQHLQPLRKMAQLWMLMRQAKASKNRMTLQQCAF